MKSAPFLPGIIWPVHPRPRPDELLSSYLARIARAHWTRPQVFWERVAGISDLLRVDQSVPSQVLAALRNGIGINARQVDAMTLIPFGAVRVLREEGKRVIAFCPECLKQDVPFYRRSWCLEYFTICGTHRVRLHKACPKCRGLIRFERLAPGRSFTSCHNCGFELRRTSTHH